MTAKSAKTSPASGIEISILVPVMNESGNIAPLVDEICAALAGRSFEIIYVDDASNDDSPAELAATSKIILIIAPSVAIIVIRARAAKKIIFIEGGIILTSVITARGPAPGNPGNLKMLRSHFRGYM